MNHEHYRSKQYRKSDRRAVERRTVLFPFGSTEWVEQIQKNYLLWPKYDRRIDDRRNKFLEQCRRRQKEMTQFLSGSKNYTSLLTEEEREMLNELSKSE